jgi:hypothetical protein
VLATYPSGGRFTVKAGITLADICSDSRSRRPPNTWLRKNDEVFKALPESRLDEESGGTLKGSTGFRYRECYLLSISMRCGSAPL